ncbi:hypothetical protein [Kitasatospora sp. NPDC004531]
MPTPPPLSTRTLIILALSVAAGLTSFRSPAWALAIATATMVYAFLSTYLE